MAATLHGPITTTAFSGPTSAGGGGSTNMGAFAQSPTVTDPEPHDGLIYEYIAWYDTVPDLTRVHVAFRTRPEDDPDDWGSWTDQEAVGGLNGAVAGDPHFSIALGVDPLGRLLVVWRAHGADEWMLWIGTGPGDVEITSNGPTPFREDDLSYPRFLNKLTGELYFSYRTGSPGGNSTQILRAWNHGSETWGDELVLINFNIPVPGDLESPYMHWMFVNPSTGTLHIAWIWARGGTTDTYHGINYMRSNASDWTAFVTAPGVAVSLPAGPTECEALAVPEDSGMPVHHGMGATAGDEPRIAYYAIDDDTVTQTNFYLLIWINGAWVRRTVGMAAAAWRVSDADEYLEVGQPHVLCVGNSTHYFYASTFELGPGSERRIQVRSCHEPTCTVWSAPRELIPLDTSDGKMRIDDRAWTAGFGAFAYVQEEMGGADSSTAVYVAEITFPEAPMGNLTEYAKNALYNKWRGRTAPAAPASHDFELHSNGVEISGGSYAAVTITNNATAYPAAAGRIKVLASATVPIEWPAFTADKTWDQIVQTDGTNAWSTQTPTGAPITTVSGRERFIDQSEDAANEYTITFPPGSLADASLHDLADFYWSGAAMTVHTSTFWAYFDGDPQDGGTQLTASGVEVDNDDTQWGAPSNGIGSNLNAIALAWEVGATHIAELDAATGGTVLSSDALSSGWIAEAPAAIGPGLLRWKVVG